MQKRNEPKPQVLGGRNGTSLSWHVPTWFRGLEAPLLSKTRQSTWPLACVGKVSSWQSKLPPTPYRSARLVLYGHGLTKASQAVLRPSTRGSWGFQQGNPTLPQKGWGENWQGLKSGQACPSVHSSHMAKSSQKLDVNPGQSVDRSWLLAVGRQVRTSLAMARKSRWLASGGIALLGLGGVIFARLSLEIGIGG